MIDVAALEKIRAEVGESVKIVAATKTVSPEIVDTLKNYGVTAAGENRVQEFLTKFEAVSGVEWHFIGRLQTNKVKYIADKVRMIQSVDRVGLVDEIDRQCEKIGKVMDILIELNVGEESKGGVTESELNCLIEYACEKRYLNIRGLMCVPPILADAAVYKRVGGIFSKAKQDFQGLKGFDTLSMGMSADYKLAVENGANMIRPGSILFGRRN